MYCFRRHHYNKSVLIWLFLVKYWEGNEFCTDIFNLFNNHSNIIDESVVEYVHSVIRRHTKDGASEKTLADTMKAIFGCGLRQENFRSTFTPARNYVFSRVQLKYLHTRVAKILVSIFSKICSSPGESYLLPKSKGQPRDCTMFILPTLFGEKPVKSYMLPLGFQCEKKPDINSRCDYICVAPEDADWQIFEGCWHSFHKESANSSFVNGGNQDNLGVDVQTSDSDSDDDSNELECDNLGINTNESNIENTLNNINLSLMQLRPQSPSNTSVNSNEQCDVDSSTLLTNVQTTTNCSLRETRCTRESLDEEQINYCAPEILEHPELGLIDNAEEKNISSTILQTFC
ncbi:Hypothetical predicted protein [Paramuricea clavata]|uniref:Uncharacterized protein n=1 Tax=Paramuricea clavata TaxID=317549 RepID=A0A7D9E2S4_PARCT|nr:Hypothetical predicted protein [Paramuricea clavata]